MNKNKKKLNLGCGKDLRKGYINIDIRSDVGADLVHDITKPFPLKESSISEVVAQDVFEHLTVDQQSQLLRELHRIMMSGAHLKIRIPNNDDIWKRFSKDPETRNIFLFGDTSESGVWGAHKSGHTKSSFTELAVISGFKVLSYSEVETNHHFEFVKSGTPRLKGIVFINQTLGMGGAENFMTQLLTEFRNQKIPIKVWTTNTEFNKSLALKRINAGKIPVVIDIIGDWKGLIKSIFLLPIAVFYYAWITYLNRDLGTILLSGFIEKILVTPWAKIFNIPVVWIEYGPLGSVFSKFFGLPKLTYRLVSKLPDFIIEPSENTRINNLNITGFSTARTKVIPCGINPLKIKEGKVEEYTAYCVSRMEKGKGQDLLIKAWSKVIRKFPKAKLYFIGEGDFQKHLENLAKNLNLNKSVVFMGKVKNVAKAVSGFSVGVFPSIWPLEGFGLVLLEAMSLGKPVICFDAGPYPEIVNSECALILEKENIEALSKGIIKIISDNRIAEKLGKNGRKRFNKYFTVGKISVRYYSVLLEAQIAAEVRKYYDNS